MRWVLYAVLALVLGAAGIYVYVNQRDPSRPVDVALLDAALKNDFNAVKQAVEAGADVNARRKKSLWAEKFEDKTWQEGYTALMHASNWGNMDVLKLLVSKGANLNIQSDDGVTALMCAAMSLQTEAVKYLLDQGADVRLKSVTGSTVLDCAKKRNATPGSRALEQLVADAMIKAGMDVKRPPDFSPGGGL